ncbi:hypothetical protein C2S53_011613 [Perilla frutescens var. hirtella]|uniref:Uncharacterized protein n=1 Tax=Perilla frutescens var. hirtella TaxID=608512 RepID=A0AAD4P0M3_PERFH|nr:hypothetical protein C2S53_011613 [Perilla frutescens var. hirtella]
MGRVNVVGGKSVRACDNCVRKRARWYCAADDAFLCESCDSSVHSANPLARRHERVRLKMESPINSSFDDESGGQSSSWHQGFTRKARTPRRQKIGKLSRNIPLHLVPEPEVCSEEENEEQLLYRVPVFEVAVKTTNVENYGEATPHDLSELDLAEFAADVEGLLGKGLEDESFDMEGLGIFDCSEDAKYHCCWRTGNIKAEDDEDIFGEAAMDEENHQTDFQLNFDEDEYKIQNQDFKFDDSNKSLLKLDYERVMSAWDDKKSPWTTGDRPEFTSGDWSTDCCLGLGLQGTIGAVHAYGDMAMKTTAMGDGGREARVSRYREKRRTRLFSKKIRYEVRKLNAEKRPRMKGRFVKRASFAASAFPLLNK